MGTKKFTYKKKIFIYTMIILYTFLQVGCVCVLGGWVGGEEVGGWRYVLGLD